MRGEKRGPACHRSPSAEPRTVETVKTCAVLTPSLGTKFRLNHGPRSRALKFESWELRRNLRLSGYSG